MSSWEVKAARKRWAVIGGDPGGVHTVHRLTGSTTSTASLIPRKMLGKWARITPIGCDAQIGFFTGSAPTLVFNLSGSATGGSSAFPSGSYSNGVTLFNGIGDEAIIPTSAPRSWVSSSYDTIAPGALPVVGFVYVTSTALSASLEIVVVEDLS